MGRRCVALTRPNAAEFICKSATIQDTSTLHEVSQKGGEWEMNSKIVFPLPATAPHAVVGKGQRRPPELFFY